MWFIVVSEKINAQLSAAFSYFWWFLLFSLIVLCVGYFAERTIALCDFIFTMTSKGLTAYYFFMKKCINKAFGRVVAGIASL